MIETIYSPNVKWASWVIITLLSTYTYIQNPIRFSSRYLLNYGSIKFNYSNLFNSLKYIIIILNLLLGYLLSISSPIFLSFKYWFVLLILLNFIVIYEMKSEPVIDDGSFNLAPNYVNTKKKYHIIILLLLVYHLVTDASVLKSLNMKMLVLWLMIVVNIIINSVLLIKKQNYSTCYYKLPVSWT